MENALKATWELMSDQPLFYTKEALFILASSNTKDTFDIYDSINKTVKAYIVVNIINLVSKAYFNDQICDRTKGKHEVALNEHDFRIKLMVGLPNPRATPLRETGSLIK